MNYKEIGTRHFSRDNFFIVVVSFLHCLSASCGARPASLVETYVRKGIEGIKEELGLGEYPAGAGICIGDVEFRCVPSPFFRTSTKLEIRVYCEVLYSTVYPTTSRLEN